MFSPQICCPHHPRPFTPFQLSAVTRRIAPLKTFKLTLADCLMSGTSSQSLSASGPNYLDHLHTSQSSRILPAHTGLVLFLYCSQERTSFHHLECFVLKDSVHCSLHCHFVQPYILRTQIQFTCPWTIHLTDLSTPAPLRMPLKQVHISRPVHAMFTVAYIHLPK